MQPPPKKAKPHMPKHVHILHHQCRFQFSALDQNSIFIAKVETAF